MSRLLKHWVSQVLVLSGATATLLMPARAQLAVAPQQPQFPAADHTLFAPVALVNGFTSAQIAVANRTDREISASLFFWDADGKQISSVPVHMQPQALEAFDFASKLNGASIDSVRSVSVSYFGVFRSLASQITLSGFQAGGE